MISCSNFDTSKLAEREGFEPPVGFHLHALSKRAHSTTLPPLRVCRSNSLRSPPTGEGWTKCADRSGVNMGIWAESGSTVPRVDVLLRMRSVSNGAFASAGQGMIKQEAVKPGEKVSMHGFLASESRSAHFSGFHGFLLKL